MAEKKIIMSLCKRYVAGFIIRASLDCRTPPSPRERQRWNAEWQNISRRYCLGMHEGYQTVSGEKRGIRFAVERRIYTLFE